MRLTWNGRKLTQCWNLSKMRRLAYMVMPWWRHNDFASLNLYEKMKANIRYPEQIWNIIFETTAGRVFNTINDISNTNSGHIIPENRVLRQRNPNQWWFRNGAWRPEIIAGAVILVPCHVVKSLLLIYVYQTYRHFADGHQLIIITWWGIGYTPLLNQDKNQVLGHIYSRVPL